MVTPSLSHKFPVAQKRHDPMKEQKGTIKQKSCYIVSVYTCNCWSHARKKPSHALVVDEVCCPAISNPISIPVISLSVRCRPSLKQKKKKMSTGGNFSHAAFGHVFTADVTPLSVSCVWAWGVLPQE